LTKLSTLFQRAEIKLGDEVSYKGHWLGDDRQGDGTLIWANGDTFSGRFNKNQPQIEGDLLVPCYAMDNETNGLVKSGQMLYIIAYSTQKTKCLCIGPDQPCWLPVQKVVIPNPVIYNILLHFLDLLTV
jgi:hypothetical protein